MKKSFAEWNQRKTQINNVERLPFFREREVWWCSLGVNVGAEEDGKNELFQRPVIVFRKFNREIVWALPMTSKKKKSSFHHSFTLHGIERTVILSQLRVLSAKRFIRRLGRMSVQQFLLLERSVEALLKETDPLRGPRVPNGNSTFTI